MSSGMQGTIGAFIALVSGFAISHPECPREWVIPLGVIIVISMIFFVVNLRKGDEE